MKTKLAQESTAPKRRSSEQSFNNRKIVKTCERDKINVTGLTGTLGTNLLRLGKEVNIIDAKSRYFVHPSKNSIIDISNNTPDSQILLLGGVKIQKAILVKLKYVPQDNCCDLEMSKHFDKTCKKINNIRAAANALRLLLLSQASSTAGNIEIYIFIGETIPETCAKNELVMKMDLRMVLEGEDMQVWGGLNGEFAKINSTNKKKKYYDDEVKPVLTGKCHLNQLVMSLGALATFG
ncbi:hypothetical protein G6F43_011672 [Rhizopus delemar]|nr:hypothetical protein G6F43_011672 [Rhizopus delemar]